MHMGNTVAVFRGIHNFFIGDVALLSGGEGGTEWDETRKCTVGGN